MEKVKIKIGKLVIAKKKNGDIVTGITKKGTKWTLYKINEKYSFFGFKEPLPFKEGDEIEFELTEQINEGGYTNFLLSLPKKDVWKKIEELEKRINDLEIKIMTAEPQEEEFKDIPVVEEE